MLSFIKSIFGRNQNNGNRIEISITKSVPDYEESKARSLLKEATKLKKENKFIEACEKLKEAYAAPGANELMVKDLLRLPMYLQLAGRNDEGWGVLNELAIKHPDVFSQVEIANQTRIFLQKEKKFRHAVLFGMWTLCKEIESDRSNIQSSIDMTDEMAKLDAEFEFTSDRGSKEKVFAHTPKGNPITDSAYEMFSERIAFCSSFEGVVESLKPFIKKAKIEEKTNELAKEFSSYLKSKEKYSLKEVTEIFNQKV